MTQNNNDDLAAKIAALKAELEAEEPASRPSAAPVQSGGEASLSDLVKQLDEPVAAAGDKTFRLVVATDWSSATLPLAVLQAYAGMFSPEAPTELVFAVPHEPSASDLGAVQVLFEGLEGIENTAPLQIEEFGEASSKPCYAAIVPSGDADALFMELAVFFTQMHRVAEVVADKDKLAQEPAPQQGHNAALARRLETFHAAR